jgi:predicted DNA-binding transcriptional regulator AlpA
MNAQVLGHAARALTEREVSDLLGLSVATLRAWRHRGQGPRFLRLGRAVRYLPADLVADNGARLRALPDSPASPRRGQPRERG